MVTQKDDEIKELKNIIEQLNSEIDMFKSMKTFMEENKEKRKSLRKSISDHKYVFDFIIEKKAINDKLYLIIKGLSMNKS